jgi:hypothetical protein
MLRSYIACLLMYLLTPWSRVHLEKLTGFQLVKNFPARYGTRRFITTVTSAHHLSPSWASSIQSIPSHPTSWRSILILSSHLRLGLPSDSFPQVTPPKPSIHLSSPPYAPPISFFSILSTEQYWVRRNTRTYSILLFSSLPPRKHLWRENSRPTNVPYISLRSM